MDDCPHKLQWNWELAHELLIEEMARVKAGTSGRDWDELNALNDYAVEKAEKQS